MVTTATRQTLSIFAKVERRQRSLEKAEAELAEWVIHIPAEDMEFYVTNSERLRI